MTTEVESSSCTMTEPTMYVCVLGGAVDTHLDTPPPRNYARLECGLFRSVAGLIQLARRVA